MHYQQCHDILVAVVEVSGGVPPPAGWTQITFANGVLAEYQSVSSIQSATSTGGVLANGGGSVCDAIIKGP